MYVSIVFFSVLYLFFFLTRDVITALEDFIKTDRELLVHVMINLRAHYTGFIQSSTTSFVKQASVGQTVLGTLDEVKPRLLSGVFLSFYGV